MSDPAPDSATTPKIAPKRRGCFGLAMKTVLGCAAFFLGVVVVLVLCLPSLCEGVVRSGAEAAFGEHFHGSLTVADVDLSWWNPQKIQDAVLLDPEKREVARVSVVLPSIRDLLSMEGPMKLTATVDADLAADDKGVSNLQRAIEPRKPSSGAEPPDRDTEDSDPLARLARLDLEAQLTSHRLTWSDPETRRRGAPFEIRDFSAVLVLKPGQPITLRATGQVVSDTPGALVIESTIHGPIEIGKSWPLGAVDAKVRIEGFSTAMVDGVAGLGGKLVEVLGPRFDLKAGIQGATPKQGGLDLDFSSEHTTFAFAGNFEGGFLRSRDDSPVRLVLGVPKGFVNDLVAPALPAGMSVAWAESERPWTVTISNLALPIPDAGGMETKDLARILERLVGDVELDLPARVAFENDQTRAAGVHAALDGIQAKVHVAPGEPATARIETALDTGSPGKIVAEASVREPWKALASGEVPVVDATVAVTGVSTRAVDALAGQGGKLAEALGPSIEIHLDARDAAPSSGRLTASVESARLKVGFRGGMEAGSLRCAGDEGLDLAWDPPAGWIGGQVASSLPAGVQLAISPDRIEVRAREIMVPVPAAGRPWTELAKEAACELHAWLPGAVWSSPGPPPITPITIAKSELTVKLLPGGFANVSLAIPLDSGSPGRIALEANAQNAFLGLESPFEATLVLEGVSTAPIDALAAQDGLLAAALGPTLSVTTKARGSGMMIDATVDLTSPTTTLRVSLEKHGDLVQATGKQGIFLSARPPPAALLAMIGPHLPEGAALSLSAQPIEISVREIAVAFPAPAAPGAPETSTLDRLESLACDVSLKVGVLHYADAHTQAAKVDLSVSELELSARVAPKKPLAAKLTAAVATAAGQEAGKLDASVSVPDPWFFLRGEDAKLPPVDADVRFSGIPIALVDGLAGEPGIASGLLGERADLEVKAQGASPDAGRFHAEITSPSASFSMAARLEKGVVVAVDEPALEATVTLTQAWLDGRFAAKLPPGSRVALVDASKPLRILVKDLRFPLPGEGVSSEALSNASLHFEAILPDIAYSHPKTAEAAPVPATVRDLKIAADIAPGSLPSASVTAKIEAGAAGEPAGGIGATVRALDPPAMLAEEKGLDRFRIATDVSAKAVPTALVDALSAQDGLLVDVLGPTVELALHSDGISLSEGTFTASLESPKAKVVCDRAGLKERVLYVEKMKGKNEAVLARAGLTPLFSERVVGSLVPMMVDLRKPEGAEPVSVAVDELKMPLDADLSKLDAVVRVNLGEVTYRLLPGLEGMLGGADAKTVKIPEIRVPIQKGVASYEGLPIRIGGRDYPFKGTFSLVDKSFRMETQVPLSVLGKKVSDKLDSLRSFLDPNMMVPLELRGTWNSPKLRVGDDFLKKLAEDALKKQGGGLLDGFLKKKK